MGDLLVGRLRDAMLGIGQDNELPGPEQLPIELARVHADFHTCHYAGLARRLPRLIRAGHALGTEGDRLDLLGQSYLLATRMLIKLDEQQLGWMAADRARQVADAAGHPSPWQKPPATSPYSPAAPAGRNRRCRSHSTPPTIQACAPPEAAPLNAAC
ncbi:hypothetical protein SAMN05216223_11675 [Actinacidiphila yanglinensis]|uniref:Uncharacterized protein n=1 Tax=Actinacidiphila yanglinensis TaxID=310779 RepID=A0A1H6DKW6_9ACTN|nr:hypothetical protein [Actinacidiphila yanglinensis]SEG85483.1 hypothetical protein SAMN05216223_11675 [Actinacidiphila yanglinensis]